MNIFIEHLSFKTYIKLYFLQSPKFSFSKKPQISYYYFDASIPGIIIANIIKILSNTKFEKINFKMTDIKDENGELVRLRIPRKDLFEIQKQITESNEFLSLIDNTWSKKTIYQYLRRCVLEGNESEDITDHESVSRVLYIINVVYWFTKKLGRKDTHLILMYRPWFGIYKLYSLQFRINLISGPQKSENILTLISNYIKKFIKKRDKLYLLIKNIKEKRYHYYGNNNIHYSLFNDGRGDINIENDGKHSDFFWIFNSIFPPNKILSNAYSSADIVALKSKDININNYIIRYHSHKNFKYKINNSVPNSLEKAQLNDKLDNYNHLVSYWKSMIKTYNIKIYFTWFFYISDHIAIKDSFCSSGGIFIIWQASYQGVIDSSYTGTADILFHHSQSTEIFDKSNLRYIIVTGYPKDYAANILKSDAIKVRKRLQNIGVKKIITIFDENSGNDNRWHTGHELQRENYYFPIKLALENPELGIIFKPKHAKTLRTRLGSIAELLEEAEKTGRVMVYEESGFYTTLAPPVLAGLSADICIHGHFGTASLECALQGIPTLVIDREGEPFHKFNILPRGKVIFNNWDDTINALNEHIEYPSGIPGFGDWSDYLDEFDPFRDGKAASRIGTYLHSLMQGFDNGLDRETIMADAAEQYAEKWGYDKVIQT